MTIPNKIGDLAYNKYYSLPDFSYNCIAYLIDNNELIWKILYYNTPDAWSLSNLTRDQKISLIYKGQDDAYGFRVFIDDKLPDVLTKEISILRIFPYRIVPQDRTLGVVSMCFDVFSHNKINTMTNYRTRVDTMAQQLVETLNGEEIGGIGYLFFDSMGDQTDMIADVADVPFNGKRVYMSTNVG